MAWEARLRVGSILGVEWEEGLHCLSTCENYRFCSNFLPPVPLQFPNPLIRWLFVSLLPQAGGSGGTSVASQGQQKWPPSLWERGLAEERASRRSPSRQRAFLGICAPSPAGLGVSKEALSSR